MIWWKTSSPPSEKFELASKTFYQQDSIVYIEDCEIWMMIYNIFTHVFLVKIREQCPWHWIISHWFRFHSVEISVSDLHNILKLLCGYFLQVNNNEIKLHFCIYFFQTTVMSVSPSCIFEGLWRLLIRICHWNVSLIKKKYDFFSICTVQKEEIKRIYKKNQICIHFLIKHSNSFEKHRKSVLFARYLTN